MDTNLQQSHEALMDKMFCEAMDFAYASNYYFDKYFEVESHIEGLKLKSQVTHVFIDEDIELHETLTDRITKAEDLKHDVSLEFRYYFNRAGVVLGQTAVGSETLFVIEDLSETETEFSVEELQESEREFDKDMYFLESLLEKAMPDEIIESHVMRFKTLTSDEQARELLDTIEIARPRLLQKWQSELITQD